MDLRSLWRRLGGPAAVAADAHADPVPGGMDPPGGGA